MKSSTHDSGEGSDPDESSEESMVTEINMCVEEITQTDGIAKKSKRWYKEFGLEKNPPFDQTNIQYENDRKMQNHLSRGIIWRPSDQMQQHIKKAKKFYVQITIVNL